MTQNPILTIKAPIVRGAGRLLIAGAHEGAQLGLLVPCYSPDNRFGCMCWGVELLQIRACLVEACELKPSVQ